MGGAMDAPGNLPSGLIPGADEQHDAPPGSSGLPRCKGWSGIRSSPITLQSSSPSPDLIRGSTRGSRGRAGEMPTDQVRGLKPHGSTPAMTNRELIQPD